MAGRDRKHVFVDAGVSRATVGMTTTDRTVFLNRIGTDRPKGLPAVGRAILQWLGGYWFIVLRWFSCPRAAGWRYRSQMPKPFDTFGKILPRAGHRPADSGHLCMLTFALVP